MYDIYFQKPNRYIYQYKKRAGFPGSSDGKESACKAGHRDQSLIWKDFLEKEMATHFNILAWKISVDRGAWWAIIHEMANS